MTNGFTKKLKITAWGLTALVLPTLSYSQSASTEQGTAIWGMYQGNARHTGYVPIEIDPKKIKKIWIADVGEQEPPGVNYTIHPASIGAKYLFVTRTNGGYSNTLQAFSPEDGHVLWSKDFGSLEVQPTAYDEGKVFVQALGFTVNQLMAFQEDTGEPLFEIPLLANRPYKFNAPVIDNNVVYSCSGTVSGISANDANSGRLLWSQEYLTNSYGATAATTQQFVLYYISGYLYKTDKLTGRFISKIKDEYWSQNYESPTPVIMDENSGLLFNNNYLDYRLSKFNLKSDTFEFTIDGVSSQPSVDDQFIYAIKDGFLTAFDKTSGKPVWNITSKSYGGIDTMIVTKNLIFVSDRYGTTAFSKSNAHEIAWESPIHGKMSLSSKGLFIVSGGLVAFSWN